MVRTITRLKKSLRTSIQSRPILGTQRINVDRISLLFILLMVATLVAGQLRITVYDHAHLDKGVSQAVFQSLRQIFVPGSVLEGDFAGAERDLGRADA